MFHVGELCNEPVSHQSVQGHLNNYSQLNKQQKCSVSFEFLHAVDLALPFKEQVVTLLLRKSVLNQCLVPLH